MATTTHTQINHDKEPVRPFRSDFLEFLSHTYPAAASIHLALLFCVAFRMVLGGPRWITPTLAGFIAGFPACDALHNADHHIPMRWGIWQALERFQLRHHCRIPGRPFKVSSPLSAIVLGTQPP